MWTQFTGNIFVVLSYFLRFEIWHNPSFYILFYLIIIFFFLFVGSVRFLLVFFDYSFFHFGGMLIWKVQNPWTGLRGQLYDYFLRPTGGMKREREIEFISSLYFNFSYFSYFLLFINENKAYFSDMISWGLYGAQSANEPLHVQLNLYRNALEIVNTLSVCIGLDLNLCSTEFTSVSFMSVHTKTNFLRQCQERVWTQNVKQIY
jgi:hypothetical protein